MIKKKVSSSFFFMITFFFHLLSSRKEMKDNRRPEQSLCPAAKLSLVNDVKWKWKSVCDDWQWCCSAGPAVLVSNLHSLFLLLSYICSVRGKLWGRGVEAWVLGLDPSVFSELVTHQIQSRREFLLFIKVTATHTHTFSHCSLVCFSGTKSFLFRDRENTYVS